MHSTTQNPIKTIVVDDNILTRCGIKALLLEDKGIELLFTTNIYEDLVAMNEQHCPDVLIISSSLLLLHCSDRLKDLTNNFPFLKVIVLYTTTDTSYTNQVAHPGLTGHLIKDMKHNELIIAIKIIYNGGIYYSKEIANTILKGKETIAKQGDAVVPKFSGTDKNILELCCKGLVTKEITGILQLAPKTIEHHKEKMMYKTGCKNSTSLAVYALLNNLVRKEQLVSIFLYFLLSGIFDLQADGVLCCSLLI